MVVLLAFLILYLILIGFALAKGKASKGLLSNVDENMCKYVDSLFENDSELKTLAENEIEVMNLKVNKTQIESHTYQCYCKKQISQKSFKDLKELI